MEREELLRVENLKKYFVTHTGMLHAVDDVSFSLARSSTLGVVGESGCGKSTLGRTILRLHEPTSGRIFFRGEDIAGADKKRMKELRRDMQIIFQDPFASLNPRMTVAETIRESLLIQGIFTKKDRKGLEERVRELMDLVGLSPIARVLALNPQFIVCDEPVSALDVSIQAQILNLMQDLQDSFGFSYLFITHDLSVVKHLSDEIMVMYLGKVVEKAVTADLFRNPCHPYTQALLSAIPVPDPDFHSRRILLKGEISSPIDPAPGCRFAARCPYASDKCRKEDIPLREVEPGHFVSCVLDSCGIN